MSYYEGEELINHETYVNFEIDDLMHYIENCYEGDYENLICEYIEKLIKDEFENVTYFNGFHCTEFKIDYWKIVDEICYKDGSGCELIIRGCVWYTLEEEYAYNEVNEMFSIGIQYRS